MDISKLNLEKLDEFRSDLIKIMYEEINRDNDMQRNIKADIETIEKLLIMAKEIDNETGFLKEEIEMLTEMVLKLKEIFILDTLLK